MSPVAVIGSGFIGPVHFEALRRAGQTVRGVLGSTLDKSRKAAEQWGVSVAYASLGELLADQQVEAVHITSPNRFHFEMAAACLRAGKHVLCEKPLAMNARESAELVRIAAESGLHAGVAYNIRYYPLCREAAEKVRTGTLGDVFHVAGSYVQDWLLWPTDFNWRVEAEAGGELRAVADIGTHWLDLAQHIAGRKIVEVCADLKTIHPIRHKPQGGIETFSGHMSFCNHAASISVNTEDYGAILLQFEAGARGVVWVSQTTAGRKNCLRFELAGSKQAMAWDSEKPNELWIGHRDQPNQTLIRDPALMSPAASAISNYPGGHNEGFPDTFKQLFREFYAAIAAGSPNSSVKYPTFADGHQEILLCEAILRSHRERRWVEVGAVRDL